MNDDFLTRYRKSPPREFAAALYERINFPMPAPRNIFLRRFMIAGAISLALIAAFAFSPNARASMMHLFKQVGGITFIGPDEPSSDPTETPEPERTVPEERLSLAEAQAKLPFAISLPTWVPEGFSQSDTVRISYFGDKFTPVEITYYGPDPQVGNIVLMVGQRVNWLVDLNSVQEVKINGESAGLTGGSWNADTGEWSGDDVSLTWMHGDVMYKLDSRGLSADQLIRIAESIP